MVPLKYSEMNLQTILIVVPSQINYVISTRFSTDKGYYVESRRGGGGYISIKRLNIESAGEYLMHIISSIGDKLSQHTCGIYIQNFIDYELVNEKEAELMMAATSDKALAAVSPSIRDKVRMDILKNMLISLEI